MGTGVGLREVGYFDCAGGGQVVVVDGIAYIGHMRSPHGTSIVDVRDPKNCKELAKIAMPPGTHSHKVRVANGADGRQPRGQQRRHQPDARPTSAAASASTMCRRRPGRARSRAGRREGKGVHRFDFDGRHVYMSPTLEGYVGTIMMIMDLKDPARPQEIGRWWMPGQWTAGGEKPSWPQTAHRCHHPLRLGNRLYTSYWLAGFVILDIEDMAKPKLVSGLDWSPPSPARPTRRCRCRSTSAAAAT